MQDKSQKDKIDARNQLETFCYNAKSNVESKLKDKIEEDDKAKVLEVSGRDGGIACQRLALDTVCTRVDGEGKENKCGSSC